MTDVGDPGPCRGPGGTVSYSLFALARAHRVLAMELLRGLSLYPGQEILLMELLIRDHQTQSELLDTVGVDHSTLSKSLARMAEAGLVSRTRVPRDRRAHVISLTARGRSLQVELDAMWAELEGVTLLGVDPDAVEPLMHTLDRIRESVIARTRCKGYDGGPSA